MPETSLKNIVICGGGFGGIKCALELESLFMHNKDFKIILVTESPHFEYHASLYRLVTGSSPLETCIPLKDIFEHKRVEVKISKINGVDQNSQQVELESGEKIPYEYLVMALGSETSYLGIPGVEKNAFGFKNFKDAVKLQQHLHKKLGECKIAKGSEKKCLTHVIIVGGGPTGVELAAQICVYLNKLAKEFNINDEDIVVELVESTDRVCNFLPEEISIQIMDRLVEIGVQILLNTKVIKEDLDRIWLNDKILESKTVVWTAGTQGNPLYKMFKTGQNGKVLVDEWLRPEGSKNIFVIGDGANIQYSGMAQTALRNADLTAQNIRSLVSYKNDEKSLEKYSPVQPIYAIPVGNRWAVYYNGYFSIKGIFGWVLRRLADMEVFSTFLSGDKAMKVFNKGNSLGTDCEICTTL